jgi:3-deoxy-D-manno-octulosonic-acid transferase
LAVFVESELWPSLLTRAKTRGARLALLGARLSQASARGWARAPKAARALLGGFDLILAQDEVSRSRIERLGGHVAGELDLKQAGAPLPCDEVALAELKAAVGRRAVVVAASTHPGEDEIIATAFRALDAPSPLLILVPRHPERGAAIASSLRARGFIVAQRSLGEPIDRRTQVYVADTLGELGLIYRLAHAVIVGGGFTGGVGGHNPLEPARLGLPIVAGSDTANFREAYAGLTGVHGALIAQDPAALARILADLISDPVRAGQMGQSAKAYAARGDAALETALQALAPLLPEGAP